MKKSAEIVALHVPTKEYRFAVLGSTDPKSEEADYCRVDPRANEKLEDFKCFPAVVLSTGLVHVMGPALKLPNHYS